jgi:hypothetical protein
MKREIQKYPYNATENEIKIFLSDQIGEQVVSITCSNGQILLSATLIFSTLFGMPKEAQPIGLPIRFPSAPEIHRPAPQYFHKYAPTVNLRCDKILMMANNNMNMIPLIYINGHYSYINEQLLKKLRAGDLASNITVVAVGIIVYIMCQLLGVDAFAILEQIGSANAPTTSTSPGFTPTTSSSTEMALVPTQAQQFNDMSLKFNEPKPNFIMTKDEALKILSKTYPGQLEIRDNERISDWQAAKKIYHVSDFGINPEDYGMTKDNILQLQRIGLTKYVREERPLPPIKLVKAYQMAVKNMCDHSQHSDGRFSSRGEQKIHQVTYSYNETGELITAGKYSPRAFNRFLDTMHLGRL